jgi:hypothetical protein
MFLITAYQNTSSAEAREWKLVGVTRWMRPPTEQHGCVLVEFDFYNAYMGLDCYYTTDYRRSWKSLLVFKARSQVVELLL